MLDQPSHSNDDKPTLQVRIQIQVFTPTYLLKFISSDNSNNNIGVNINVITVHVLMSKQEMTSGAKILRAKMK